MCDEISSHVCEYRTNMQSSETFNPLFQPISVKIKDAKASQA